jgi:cell division protein FtsQ
MAQPRLTSPRKSSWFRGKRNRRVRLTPGPRLPSLGGFWRGCGAALRRWARGFLLVGLAAALGGAGFALHRYATHAPHFAVKALRLPPLAHVSPETLEARAGAVLGQNLFQVDLEALAREVLKEPWIASARARRELPATVALDLLERRAACAVALGPLYLADEAGQLFKRAGAAEAAGLPVVTGLERHQWLDDGQAARDSVAEAVRVATAWQRAARPALGELHWDRLLGLTLYTRDGVGVRLGRPDDSLSARLARFDAVWAALAAAGERPRFIYLDSRARPDRVTVKLAAPAAQPGTQSET